MGKVPIKRKKSGILPNQGRGVSEGSKKTNLYFGMYFFSEHVESF